MERIAIVVGKMDSGGKKNLIMEYYRHIDREKIQFDFICDSDSQAIPKEEIDALGGKVYIVRPYQKIFSNIKDIKKILRENHYRVVHAYNNTLNVFSMYAAKRAGVPIRINESLSMGHRKDKKNIIKKVLRPFTKRFSTHFLSCGNECGRWQFGKKFFAQGKVEVFKTVIDAKFNRYDPEIRERTRRAFGWTDKTVVGFIGRFTAQKNPMFLLDIFQKFAETDPNAILCLIGDGELREKMLDKIKALHLENNVNYLGRREDIQQFYNAMDAFLLPSLFEGLPVVGLEAECCGLPVFFSDEISKEASVCELGHFMSLEASPKEWADEMIQAIQENISNRRDRSMDIENSGFDSHNEAIRLQNYYLDLLKTLPDKN